MRAPLMKVNGSGKNALLGSDANDGMGGTVQAPPPPVPACVTVTVCDGAPLAAAVTSAVRAALPVFACAVTVTVALLEPEVGLTVSQAWSSLTVQLVLDERLNVAVLLAAAATFTADGDTESVVPVEQLPAAPPVPVGNAADVLMLILSSRAPSSR